MANHSKIAIITSVHNALDGRIFQKEARALAAQGYQISLIAPNSLGSTQTIESAGMIFEGLESNTKRSARPIRWRQVAKLLWINRKKYVIWHIHDPELLLICVPCRLLFARNVKIVYDVHEDYSAAVRSKSWLPFYIRGLVSRITLVLEQILSKFCSLIIGATPQISANFTSSPNQQIITIHNYPIVSDEKGSSPSLLPTTNDHIRCVYAGGISSIRGVKEIIDAFSLLSSHPVELLIAGPSDPVDFIDTHLEHRPKNISYLGVLSWEEVPELLGTCDIGLLCFLPEPNHLNSLPTKLFEYLNAGLAIVASDFDYWETIILKEQVGVLVDPTKPASIAHGVLSLIENQSLRENLRARGPNLVKNKYSWESQAHILCAAYDRLTESG